MGSLIGGDWELMWGVMYKGFRNGDYSYYKEKWKGVESKQKNEDKGIYEGEIKNGLPDGQGKLTFPDDSGFIGEFKNGEKWNGTRFEPNGKISSWKVVNGKNIKQ